MSRKIISRRRSGRKRAALFGAGALVLLAGAALPFGLSSFYLEPFQKAAQAKGPGSGGGGPPDHSNAGGNGNGHGGGVWSASHGGEGYEGPKLGKLNAANASLTGLQNANENSTPGQLYIYMHRVEDEDITNFDDAKLFLDTFANKEVTEEVVDALHVLLGLDPFPPPEE